MAEKIVTELTLDALKSKLHYNPETGIFTWIVRSGGCGAGHVAGSLSSTGYIKIKIFRKEYTAHRLAWFYLYGEWPSQFIDHINRQKTDNRIKNLRNVSKSDNGRNREALPNNASGKSGVNWVQRNRRWQARASKHGKRFHLGYFSKREDAFHAIDEWIERNPII